MVIASLIYSALGRGALGRAATQAARAASSAIDADDLAVTPGQKEAAVVEAFRSVQSRFVWVEGRWISAKAANVALSAFDVALAGSKLDDPYDQQVLARILVEVARSDRSVNAQESSWLTEMLPASVGSVRELAARPPLTDEELSETSPEERQVMLMLAWTMAYMDEAFTEGEGELLKHFATGLQLSSEHIAAAKGAAREHVLGDLLQRALEFSTLDEHARTQLTTLAQRLGIPEDEARLIEARVQRRLAQQ